MEKDPLALDDDNVSENSNELAAPKIQPKCHQPIPIVYTTKLDDMNIFTWNFDLLTSDIISSCIIEESKPKLLHINKYTQPKNDTSFQNMVQSLNKMNSNVKGNNKTLLEGVSERKNIHNNADVSENSASKRRRIDINSQFDSESTSENVTTGIKTEPLELFSQETASEINEVVERRLVFCAQLATETIDMEICTKEEPLEVSTPESNCEIIKRRTAMTRKDEEINPQSTAKTAADEEICLKVETSDVSVLGSNSDLTEKNKRCYYNSICEINEKTKEHDSTSGTKTADGDLMRERNKKLLKLCKPVSVVLDDIGASIRGKPPNNYKCNNITGKSKNISESSLTVENKDKTIDLGFPSLNLNTYWKSQYFLYYNEFSSELDIYYIDGSGQIRGYYRLDGDKTILSRTVLLPYIGTEDAVMLTCCCWHQRDQTIKSLWPGVISYSASKFLKKPHSCDPDNCICCCQNRSTYIRYCSSSTDKKNTTCDNAIVKPFSSAITPLSKTTLPSMEVGPISTDDYELHDLENETSSTIIQMQEQLDNNVAVKHNNVWLRQLLVTSSDSRNLINKALRYTRETPYNKPTFKKTCIETSDVSRVIKIVNKNKSEAEWYEISINGEVLAYTTRYNGFPFSKHILIREICCWVSREHVIANLFKLEAATKGNKCSAIKFIRKPHFCPPGNCRCCCKNKDKSVKRVVSVSDITLPKRIITTKSAIVTQPNKVHTTNKISCTQPVNILTKIATDTSTEDQGVVNSLITTILDTFKDVRLTITEDGKVAAALKKPVNTLSTAELKVLSNILFHAQEQVKILGLSPGTNLNNHIQFSNVASQTIINHTQSASNTAPVTTKIASAHLDTPNSANRNSSVHEVNNRNSKQECITNKLAITNPSKSNNFPLMTTDSNYISFPKIYSENKQNYINSFISYTQSTRKPTETVIPRIKNVFSLQNENSNSSTDEGDLSALRAVWENKSTNVTKSEVNKGRVDVHHKSVQKETSTQTKIRVVSPSKLGVSNNPAILNTFNALTNIEMQTQTKPIDQDPTMIPGHIVPNASTVNTERNQVPLVMSISGGLIQLVPLTTQAESDCPPLPPLVQIKNVNAQLSQDACKNNAYMMPLANNMQLLPQVHTGDISMHQVTEVDPEEIDIPEFRITKPTSLRVNSAPIESAPVVTVSQPRQSCVKDDKFMKHISEMNAADKSSKDVTLTPVNFNVTHQRLINNTIDQDLNSAGTEVPNARLLNLLVAPSKAFRLQERKSSPKVVERNCSVNKKSKVIPRKKQTEPKTKKKAMKPLMKSALATLRKYSSKMPPKANSTQKSSKNKILIEMEPDKVTEVLITLSDSENEEDVKIEDALCDVNIFDDVGDGEVNHDLDYDENNSGNDDDDGVCILGV